MTGECDAVSNADAARLRMVSKLLESGELRSGEVIKAFETVPRHLFTPAADVAKSYDHDVVVVTKRDAAGSAMSSVSAPVVQAMMLEQADIKPGMTVLEIGSGGYNAALIAELVGPEGTAVTMDIDQEITSNAKQFLTDAGYDQVHVITADAEHGVPEFAPYDRIIVTVGAWDVPNAWRDQLADGGRLVLPLRMRAITRSISFDLKDDWLDSVDYRLCGFVPMQGVGEHSERVVPLDDDTVLYIDESIDVDENGLAQAWKQPVVEAWSGVEFDQIPEMTLWLTMKTPQYASFRQNKGAFMPTWVDGESFARLKGRPRDGQEDSYEVGAHAYGPQAKALADKYVELLRQWEHAARLGQRAKIRAYPKGTSDDCLPEGKVIEKRCTRIVVSLPGD